MNGKVMLVEEPAVFHHTQRAEHLDVIFYILDRHVIEGLDGVDDLIAGVFVSENH